MVEFGEEIGKKEEWSRASSVENANVPQQDDGRRFGRSLREHREAEYKECNRNSLHYGLKLSAAHLFSPLCFITTEWHGTRQLSKIPDPANAVIGKLRYSIVLRISVSVASDHNHHGPN